MLNDLHNIIRDFASREIIFSNEEQFQFLLAIELLNKKGYNVSLEVLSMENDEKMYTDIIVENDDGTYTALELKYKLQNKNLVYKTGSNTTYYTFKQGANNLGRYAYLQDVERLERLIHERYITNDPTHENITFNFDLRKKVTKGYAIIISNDQNYWKEISTDRLSSGFSLEHETTISSGYHTWQIKLDENDNWIDGNSKVWSKIIPISNPGDRNKYMKQKKKPANLDYVILDNDYDCKWEDYSPNIISCLDYNSNKRQKENYEFKYLILEVN